MWPPPPPRGVACVACFQVGGGLGVTWSPHSPLSELPSQSTHTEPAGPPASCQVIILSAILGPGW
uniref:Uncharacterized protein n=1 Tax=Anguilla anguilla TaxID=7936 RepID=A0A0E9Q100_ANGAN